MIHVIGLGPGATDLLAPRAAAALQAATDIVGYGSYLDRVPPRAGQMRHVSGNRAELARARDALTLAQNGRRVALVSGGDAGVFGIASALFEAVEHGPPAWRGLEIEVVPGISALLAAAARVGAPLGHDFCVLSLSDNLKPWEAIVARLAAAAIAGFAIAIYNPASRARTWQLGAAFEMLRMHLPAATPVIFATSITRTDERISVATLGAADPALADMRTLVLIGTQDTRVIERPGAAPWIYAPRGEPA